MKIENSASPRNRGPTCCYQFLRAWSENIIRSRAADALTNQCNRTTFTHIHDLEINLNVHKLNPSPQMLSRHVRLWYSSSKAFKFNGVVGSDIWFLGFAYPRTIRAGLLDGLFSLLSRWRHGTIPVGRLKSKLKKVHHPVMLSLN